MTGENYTARVPTDAIGGMAVLIVAIQNPGQNFCRRPEQIVLAVSAVISMNVLHWVSRGTRKSNTRDSQHRLSSIRDTKYDRGFRNSFRGDTAPPNDGPWGI